MPSARFTQDAPRPGAGQDLQGVSMRRTRAFVMGHPVSHSRSPMLHGYWLRTLGIEGSYDLADVAPAEVEAFFRSFREENYIGCNVTVPNKTAVIPFLDRIDADATTMGAVNTIWWEGDDLVGGNTDALGFIANIDEIAPGWDKGGKNALVLGAGGATRAVIYGLLGRGFKVALCNRTLEKAQSLAKEFGTDVSAHSLAERDALLAKSDLLVNATSLGMVGQPQHDIDLGRLKPGAVVYDIVYVPLETALLKQAAAKGHRTVTGLGMLLHQGAVGFSRWFGRKPQVTQELRDLLVADIWAKTPGV